MAFGFGGLQRLVLHQKYKMKDVFNRQFNVLYQGVEYTYSSEKPTEIGDYWHVDENAYFAIWE